MSTHVNTHVNTLVSTHVSTSAHRPTTSSAQRNSWAVTLLLGAALGAGCAADRDVSPEARSGPQATPPPAPASTAQDSAPQDAQHTTQHAAPHAARQDTPASRLRALVPDLLRRHFVPGLTLCLIDRGRITWTAAFGARRDSDQAPMDEETVFEGGDLALPMLAQLALTLVDEQALDLDQPLGELLVGFAPDDPGARTITTAMLLQQSSGLVDGDGELFVATPPGSEFQPSMAGQRLLQRVLEQVGGAPLQELLEQRVFGPAGMDSTSMIWRDAYNERASAGHDLPGRLPSTVRRKDRPGVADAPTSLHTTAGDLARFVIATMGSNDAAAGSERRASLLRPALEIDAALGLSHGLGWALETSADGLTAYQWGATPHFRAFVLMHPADQSGLVVLTNGVAGLELMEELVAACDSHEHPLFEGPRPDSQG